MTTNPPEAELAKDILSVLQKAKSPDDLTNQSRKLLSSLNINPDDILSLSDQERAYLFQALEEFIQYGSSPTATSLLLEDYKWEPVTMEQFLSDPYYLGDITKDLYPVWRKALIEIFDSEKRPVEVILGGAIGTGKCLASHELCFTVRGLLTMREVYDEQPVQIQTRVGLRTVQHYHYEGLTKTVRVETSLGHTLEGRPNHRVLVLDVLTGCEQWKTLEQVVAGDVVLQCEAECGGYTDIIPVPYAELIGWYFGGGRKVSPGVYQFVLDRAYQKYFESLVERFHGQTSIVNKNRDHLEVRATIPIVPPEIVFPDLKESIPKCVRQSTKAVWAGFLKGLFLGYLNAYQETGAILVHVSLEHEGLAQQVRVMLMACGVQCTCLKTSDRHWTITFAGRDMYDKFCSLSGFSWDRTPKDQNFEAFEPYVLVPKAEFMALQRLHDADVAFLEKYLLDGRVVISRSSLQYLKKLGAYLPESLRSIADGKRFFDVVVKKSDGEAVCYDVSMEGDPSYVAGGFISHNTTVAAIALTYLTYRLTCLRDPHAYYNLMPGQPIVIGLYSIDLEQAMATSYGKILNWLDNIPYFLQKCPRVRRINSVIKFSSSPVQIIAGSKETHTIGRDMYAFCLDEANFMRAANGEIDEGVAFSIYNNAVRRLKSRFLNRSGEPVGMAILASSKRTKAAFLEQHIRDSRQDILEGRTRVYSYAQWEVKPQEYFRKRKFRVEIGDRLFPSRILQDGEAPREGADVILVPGEYLTDFQNDIDKALRDLAGVASDSVLPLFHDRSVLRKACTAEHQHPFTKQELVLSIQDDIGVDAYFRPELMFRVVRSRYQMQLNPQAYRYIHIDIGITGDAMGISMVHLAGFRVIKRPRKDGTYFEDKAPLVVVDFMLRINPPQGSEIDLAKARAFILSLIDMGVPVRSVSYDGHQSRESVQALKKIGIPANIISVDRDDQPYLMLRQCFIEQRIVMYEYPRVIQELSELERDIDHRKIDHPRISPTTGKPGSKDVADSLCGAVYSALMDKEAILTMDVNSRIEQRFVDPTSVTPTKVGVTGGYHLWSNLDKGLG